MLMYVIMMQIWLLCYNCNCFALVCSNKVNTRFNRVNTKLQGSLESTLTSLTAGSISGAIGVLAAYPFDSLKTKAQAYSQKENDTVVSLGLIELAQKVVNDEGISAFYSGVTGVMIGQAFIKSVAFSSNSWALSELTTISPSITQPTLIQLIIASCFSGAITSFIVNPIERIKVLMQADSIKQYKSEVDCLKKVVANDGVRNFMFRGIDSTLFREIPGYGIYFVIYSVFTSNLSETLGPFATPLICGALAGVLSWIPVYPFDVVKTYQQNSQGSISGKQPNMIQSALDLYKLGGLRIFIEGITPKLLRAAINHSVTFFIYDLIIKYMII